MPEAAVGELEHLRAELSQLLARQQILDCIHRAARGLDRHDVELLASAFHPDAVVRYGKIIDGVPGIARKLNEGHASSSRAHTHNITTHNCRIDGDSAEAESYVLAGLASGDRTTVRLLGARCSVLGARCSVLGARYLDVLDKRNDRWLISAREVVIEWSMSGDASAFHSETFNARGYPTGSWDGSDPSYRIGGFPRA
ncbi:nuclear transport factor 2 family protein [Rhodococcus sp. WS4]|nr:nuclear transport factor 2 family protein [Rhodococcus sp. WS4]